MKITNSRVPKTGVGTGFGNMVEENRPKKLIQITSSKRDARNHVSGFDYDSTKYVQYVFLVADISYTLIVHDSIGDLR